MRRGRALNLSVFVFAVAVVSLAIFQTTPVHAATSPTAKIVSVHHPDHEFPGSSLQVGVVIEYSDRFLADIGIWDDDAGLMVQSLTFISEFTSVGQTSFTFNLTAPSTEGEWHLFAVNRVWWQNAWYLDPNGGALPFNITISKAPLALTLSTRGANAPIKLDGTEYQLNDGTSVTLSVQAGTHSLSAPSIIQGPAGERFVFVGWTDGLNSNPRQVFVVQDQSLQAIYRTEYYLSVKSDFGQTSGEGWYESGTEAHFALGPNYAVPVQSGFLREEYKFVGWSGDSNSTSELASLTMNGPRSIKAVWTLSVTGVDLSLPIDVFFVGSLLLGGTAIIRYSMRHSRTQSSGRATRIAMNTLVLVLIILVASMILPSGRAAPIQPKVSIVKIADAQWYYWNQPESDTCILWLGGGISDESIEGYYSYWVNPFSYESFGTVRFIQDLAKYYCLVALEVGSTPAFNPTANRTINQELIQSQSTILAHVHDWIKQQGYQHTYLVGYSVGAQAAANDAAHTDSEDWTSRDGLVLITVPLAKTIIESAHELRANLMFLYGGNLPDYQATGQQFYDSAPSEGWHGTYFFHKEFHVLEDVGHEVWTIRQTGAYDSTAVNLIISFVERSKALQYQPARLGMVENSTASANTTATVTSVQAPSEVAVGEPFVVEVNVSYKLPTGQNTTLIAYDSTNHTVLSAGIIPAGWAGSRAVRLVMPPFSNASQPRLSFLVLVKSSETWVPSSNPYPVNITVTNLVKLSVETSVPNITILFDGTSYLTDSTGKLQIDTVRGSHTISVLPLAYLNNVSRVKFLEWEDSTNETSRQVELSNNSALIALYSKQYFVGADSDYGTTEGSGWYDVNATATVIVSPPMISQPPAIFTHWVGDSNESSLRILLTVDSPKVVSANWSLLNTSSPADLSEVGWLALSIFLFCVLLALNLRWPGRRKSAHQAINE
ncbi:MAG: hypothetical protein ABSE39_09125 [Candidatus Bathyarchaeia archaeon]|jgi:hypothetical protein